uniref:Matrix metalloproteinase-25-like n=1 Tax=Sinocyclocheilus grahami TaxID=75366 RepID=A0A672QZD2_SINGR
LDHATLELMARPRCSLPDTISSEDLLKERRRGKGKLKRRYTLPRLSWDKADITWSVQEFPSPSMSPTLHPGLVRLILTSALRVWSDVTPLRFHPPPYGPSPQIDIKITFASSYHEDGYPFDGKGGNLAHAFFPGKGDLAGDKFPHKRVYATLVPLSQGTEVTLVTGMFLFVCVCIGLVDSVWVFTISRISN